MDLKESPFSQGGCIYAKMNLLDAFPNPAYYSYMLAVTEWNLWQ